LYLYVDYISICHYTCLFKTLQINVNLEVSTFLSVYSLKSVVSMFAPWMTSSSGYQHISADNRKPTPRTQNSWTCYLAELALRSYRFAGVTVLIVLAAQIGHVSATSAVENATFCSIVAATNAESVLSWSCDASHTPTVTVCNASGISCDVDGLVISLVLDGSGLTGTIY
jgi:hypothetical protein